MNTKLMNNCEINFIKNVNNTENCNIRTGKFTNEVWLKLRQQNSWVYIIPEEQKIFINCKNYFENIALKDTGIIELGETCKIKTNNVEISAFRNIEKNEVKRIFPSVNWKRVLDDMLEPNIEEKQATLKDNVEPKIINMDQSIKLSEMSMGIERIRGIEENNKKESMQKITNNKICFWQILIWIIIGTIISMTTCFMINKKIRVTKTYTHKIKSKPTESSKKNKRTKIVAKSKSKSSSTMEQTENEIYEDMSANKTKI